MLSLRNLLVIIYMLAHGVPIKFVEYLSFGEVTKKSVIQWYTYDREICSQELLLDDGPILGTHKRSIVHPDETFTKHNRKYKKVIRGKGLKNYPFLNGQHLYKKCFIE